jgi:hypothetical protein
VPLAEQDGVQRCAVEALLLLETTGTLMPSIQANERQPVQIEDDGRMLASAEVHATDRLDVVHTDLHVESGPLPPATGSRIVDALLEHPDVHSADHLSATMPLGDTEMLQRVRERCEDVEAHAAGATKIVDARLTRTGDSATEEGAPGAAR